MTGSGAMATASAQRPDATVRAIPFRDEGPGLASQAVDVLLVLILLLAACLGIALYARKRGWLDRWTGARAKTPPARGSLQVEQMSRLSPKTTLYRVNDADRRYLIVESSVAVQVVELGMADRTHG